MGRNYVRGACSLHSLIQVVGVHFVVPLDKCIPIQN